MRSPGNRPPRAAGPPGTTRVTRTSRALVVLADVDAEQGVAEAAVRVDLGEELSRHRGGDGEGEALAVAAHGGGQADDLAAQVDERPAGVAEVDRRVGLDEAPHALGVRGPLG